MESESNVRKSTSDFRATIIKDCHRHPKMGLSEKSKTFTIENLLKSDGGKTGSSATSANSPPPPPLLVHFKPEAVHYDLLSRLDFSRPQDQVHLNWLRLQNAGPTSSSTHYLLGGLPGNYLCSGTRSFRELELEVGQTEKNRAIDQR